MFWGGFVPLVQVFQKNLNSLRQYYQFSNLSPQSEHHGPPNCYAHSVTGECELNAWTIVGQETRQDSQTQSLWVTALHRYLALVLGLETN